MNVNNLTEEQAIRLFNHVREASGAKSEAAALVFFAKAVVGDGLQQLLESEKAKLQAKIAEIDTMLA